MGDTMINLVELRRLEAATTLGPWEASETHPDAIVSLKYTDIHPDHYDWYHGLCVSESSEARDVEFIAAVRNALPEVLALLEEAGELADLIDAEPLCDPGMPAQRIGRKARAFRAKLGKEKE